MSSTASLRPMWNGDSIPDIVVAGNVFGRRANGVIGVLLGNGDGTFTASTSLSLPGAGSANMGVTIDDVNGDGSSTSSRLHRSHPVRESMSSSTMEARPPRFPHGHHWPLGAPAVWRQRPIHLQRPQRFGPELRRDPAWRWDRALHTTGQTVGAGQFAGLTAADYNRDSKVDLAFINNAAETIDVYFGNGDGTFTYSASYPSIPAAPILTPAISMATAIRTSSSAQLIAVSTRRISTPAAISSPR